MYKALYRKYRPLVFSDVVGQEHITVSLKNQVESGKVSHAYLFTGSRGTGKTTCAKILARAINCTNPKDGNPCGECENCVGILSDSLPDVVEIDAASNNGVDYIRDLRERIVYAPAKTKYRVYIIDEVHMLSAAASNALLKTLEEPPEHAVFILATTEINSILPTILSRCQRYDFKRIEPSLISSRLKYVAECENVSISDDAAMLIANIADGGMRDALSILDLCVATSKEITEQTVNTACGRAGVEYLFKLGEAINKRDTATAMKTVAELHDNSIDMQRLGTELCEFYRTVTLICSGIEPKVAAASTDALAQKYAAFSSDIGIENAMYCLRVFNEALSNMNTANRRSELEIAIIKLCTPRLDTTQDALLSRIASLERAIVTGTVAVTPAPDTANDNTPKEANVKPQVTDEFDGLTPPPEDEETEREIPETPNTSLNNDNSDTPFTQWPDVISDVFKRAPLMYGLLSGTSATVSGNKLIIHTGTAALSGQLKNVNGINYKGLCEAIINVSGKQLIPVMEDKPKTDTTDPLVNLQNKIDLLSKK